MTNSSSAEKLLAVLGRVLKDATAHECTAILVLDEGSGIRFQTETGASLAFALVVSVRHLGRADPHNDWHCDASRHALTTGSARSETLRVWPREEPADRMVRAARAGQRVLRRCGKSADFGKSAGMASSPGVNRWVGRFATKSNQLPNQDSNSGPSG